MDKLQILKHPDGGHVVAVLLNSAQLQSVTGYQIQSAGRLVQVVLELSKVDVTIMPAQIREIALDNNPES